MKNFPFPKFIKKTTNRAGFMWVKKKVIKLFKWENFLNIFKM